jgi:Alpha-glutamyl/putrescinyl thymine pyrophosphorylase clade 3
VPTFCRHNRFIERCPICSKTLPGGEARGARPRARTPTPQATGARRRGGGESPLSIQREARAADDGYRCSLTPGLRASSDAERLLAEVAFASARLTALAGSPPGLYGEARSLAGGDLEQASWICLLIAYISPLQGEEPFAGIRRALLAGRESAPDLEGIVPGPRSSHDPARGGGLLEAYLRFAEQAGSQASALTGDEAWSPERRFERIFERLALGGFARRGRYEFLILLGRLGLYELRPDSLHLAGQRGPGADDDATTAAKRVFGIGDPPNLERRALALARAISVPLEALDLALANWGSSERATLGFPADICDHAAARKGRPALGL